MKDSISWFIGMVCHIIILLWEMAQTWMWLFVRWYAFVEKAQNIFSLILSNSESAHEFAEALKALPRHACDEHKWDGGKCTFHALKVCSCGECQDDADFKCDSKDYHTRQILKCPMHSLAYEIECTCHRIKGLQSLSNLFTPFSNEATQTGLRHHTMFLYTFGQNISTWRGFTILYPQSLHH